MFKNFNPDNPVYQFLDKLSDFMIINIMFILFSLPIVTIVPSAAAMYYTLTKLHNQEIDSIFLCFFRSFKQNLKQGIFTGIILIIVGGILLFDLLNMPNLLTPQSSLMSNISGIFVGLFSLLFFFILLYLAPILSQYNVSTKYLFLNALLFSIKNLFTTILLAFLSLVIPLLCLFSIEFWRIAFIFYITIGFAFIANLKNYFIQRTFFK